MRFTWRPLGPSRDEIELLNKLLDHLEGTGVFTPDASSGLVGSRDKGWIDDPDPVMVLLGPGGGNGLYSYQSLVPTDGGGYTVDPFGQTGFYNGSYPAIEDNSNPSVPGMIAQIKLRDSGATCPEFRFTAPVPDALTRITSQTTSTVTSQGLVEQQAIQVPASTTGGTFILNVGTFSGTSTAAAAQTVLDAFYGAGVVTASNGPLPAPIYVTWSAPGPQPLMTVTSSSLTLATGFASIVELQQGSGALPEIQIIEVPAQTTGGTFDVIPDEFTTTPLVFSGLSSAAAAQTLFDGLFGPGVVTVTGGPLPTWLYVTWDTNGQQPLMTVTSSSLTLTGHATIAETQAGISRLNYQGWPGQVEQINPYTLAITDATGCWVLNLASNVTPPLTTASGAPAVMPAYLIGYDEYGTAVYDLATGAQGIPGVPGPVGPQGPQGPPGPGQPPEFIDNSTGIQWVYLYATGQWLGYCPCIFGVQGSYRVSGGRGGTGGGGSGGGVLTTCCANLMPVVLYAHFSNATGACSPCMNGYVQEAIWNGVLWEASGKTNSPCTGTSDPVFLQCTGGVWKLTIVGAGGGATFGFDSVNSTCSPTLSFIFNVTLPALNTICPGAGTFKVTFLSVP